MSDVTWEKSTAAADAPQDSPTHWEKANNPELARLTRRSGRWKFLVGGVLILASIVYLVVSNTLLGARFFITVGEVAGNAEYVGQTVRISGAVLGETIVYDSENLDIAFTISHIPADFSNLAEALHASVNDPSQPRLSVLVPNQVKPDLLQHEAQAILTGTLGEDGVFHATELLLKCPSRFEDGGSSDTLGEDHPGMRINAG
jgi:cytochrome c-type biogenesis protein CcmE